MQIKKTEIGKIFEKLGLEVRSTKHRYGWFCFKGRKILFLTEKVIFREEFRIKFGVS